MVAGSPYTDAPPAAMLPLTAADRPHPLNGREARPIPRGTGATAAVPGRPRPRTRVER
ncbi:hypothetical protein GCM10009731_20310 [Streptomyces globosus]